MIRGRRRRRRRLDRHESVDERLVPGIALDGVEERLDEAVASNRVDHYFRLGLQLVDLVSQVRVDQRLRRLQILENRSAGFAFFG